MEVANRLVSGVIQNPDFTVPSMCKWCIGWCVHACVCMCVRACVC